MGNEDILKEYKERYAKGDILLRNIKDNLFDLEELLEKISGLAYEDRIYRFYHHSFKVYWLQELTEEMVKILRKLSPHTEKGDKYKYRPFCEDFETIYLEGSGWEHKLHHNLKWGKVTRSIVEAFLHSKYFIEMAVKYGKELNEAPNILPSGWAALLELYNIR